MTRTSLLLWTVIAAVASAPPSSAETLREAASVYSPVLYGGAITNAGIGSQLYDNTARLHLGVVSPENDMKMGPLRPNRTTFNFGPADNIVRWARAAGQGVRGHALVWH